MYSIGLSLKLRAGGYDGYKEAHDNLWPEIAQTLEANNISMVIYHFGDHLFLHAVAPTEADWLRSREPPILKQWNEVMANYLATDEKGDIILKALPLAFNFGMFKSE